MTNMTKLCPMCLTLIPPEKFSPKKEYCTQHCKNKALKEAVRAVNSGKTYVGRHLETIFAAEGSEGQIL